MKNTPIEVTQGRYRIKDTTASVWKEADNLVVLLIDGQTKRGEVGCIGSGNCPFVEVAPVEDSLYYNTDTNDDTLIEFPEYGDGWYIHMASVSRYTISVLLIKDE